MRLIDRTSEVFIFSTFLSGRHRDDDGDGTPTNCVALDAQNAYGLKTLAVTSPFSAFSRVKNSGRKSGNCLGNLIFQAFHGTSGEPKKISLLLWLTVMRREVYLRLSKDPVTLSRTSNWEKRKERERGFSPFFS